MRGAGAHVYRSPQPGETGTVDPAVPGPPRKLISYSSHGVPTR